MSRSFGAVLIALASLALQAKEGPTRTAQPDFTGVWEAGDDYTLRVRSADGGKIPFQQWSLEAARKERAEDKAGRPTSNNNQRCLPPGLIRQYKGNFPFMIVQTEDQLTFLFEENTRVSIVHLNSKAAPANQRPTWYGYSVGHWEGDTLVIETTGTNGRSPLPGGIVMTDAARYTHRFRLIDDGKNLEDRVTIDDPKAYTRPWEILTVFERHPPEFRLREYVCAENNQDLWND